MARDLAAVYARALTLGENPELIVLRAFFQGRTISRRADTSLTRFFSGTGRDTTTFISTSASHSELSP